MANFLHREEVKRSRQRQLKADPIAITHFCKASRKLTAGHRAVLVGRRGKVFARGFVIASFQVCRPDEISDEDFARAPDIADSLDKLLPRLPSWGADANSVQVVRLEKQGYEAEDCDDVEMSVRDQKGKVIRCPYCGSEEDCEHTLAVIDTTWAVCEGGYSYKRFDEFGTAIEEYFLQQLRKGTRNVSGRRDRLIGELWNHAVEKYSPGGRRNLDWTLRIDGVDHRPIRGVGCKTGHIWIDHGLPGFACAYRTFYAKKPKTVFEAALAELRARLKKAKLPRKAYRKTF